MTVLNITFDTGRAGAFIILSINEDACADEWFEEVPLFAYLVTMADAWEKSDSISEKIMWSNQLVKGIKVFLSGKAPISKEDSIDFDWWEIESEYDSCFLNLDNFTLENVQNFSG
jgi:hypothetical protein